MTAVPIAESQQIIAKTDVNDIIFPQGTEIGFALDIKALDFIEEITFQKRIHICLHSMCTGSTFTFFVVQKPLVYQCVADGCNRNTGTDVICKEQDDFTQQRRICNLFLAPVLFSL